ncbi:MAG: HAD family hydrolase [Clostridia bacterium]
MTDLIKEAEALIFDGDGTLYDTLDMWDTIDYRLINAIGGNANNSIVGKDRDEFLHNNNTGDVFMNYANFLRIKYNSSFMTEQINSMRNTIAMDYLKNVEFKPYALEFLIKSKQEGKHLCLATLSSKWVIDIYSKENGKLNSKFPIEKLFDVILTKEDVTLKKPDPQIYNLASKLLNVPKNKCVIFEDSLTGVQAGKSSGISVVNVFDKHTSGEDLAKIQEMTNIKIKDWKSLLFSHDKEQ